MIPPERQSRVRALPPLLAGLLLVASCGDARPSAVSRDVGTAADRVQCRFKAEVSELNDGYDNGAVTDTPRGALEEAYGTVMGGPQGGYTELEHADDAVMYGYLVDGEVKQAALVKHGKTLVGTGWYLHSWAHCDLAELPPEVAEARGTGIWSDADGVRRPTTEVASYRGPEHCDWEDMTFLHLGPGRRTPTYVRKLHAELSSHAPEPFQADVPVPGDAVDTGYHLDDQHLWLSPDKQRAYVGTRDSAELWPRITDPLGCA